MTATQVFYMFLKRELSLDGHIYFHRILKGEYAGSYWRNQGRIRRTNFPKGSNTFVEDFLSKGRGRTLDGFMGNLLKHIESGLVTFKRYNGDYRNREVRLNPWGKYTNDIVYVDTYVRLWHDFLKKYIENSGKRIYNGEIVDYKLKDIEV